MERRRTDPHRNEHAAAAARLYQQHNNNDEPQRKLQQSSSSSFIYRANYTAAFQHLADPSCRIDDPPVLIISCPETARNLTIGKVSHASITCSRVVKNEITLNTSYECRNTCNTTTECTDVYVFTNSTSTGPMDASAPYGAIQFTCDSGDQMQQVAATFTYEGREAGSCTSAANETRSRNFHVAKLGISCPISDDDGATTIIDYVYDDTYFECNFRTGHEDAQGAVFNSVMWSSSSADSSDVYTCVTGKDCRGSACADVVYNNLILTSDVSQFRHCIETTLPMVTSVPTTAPVLPLPVTSYYQAQFEALWAKLYDSSPCPSNTTVRITCDGGYGVTAIRYHNSTDANMHCTHINDVELQCTASDDILIQNRFSSVIYVSLEIYIQMSQGTTFSSYMN